MPSSAPTTANETRGRRLIAIALVAAVSAAVIASLLPLGAEAATGVVPAPPSAGADSAGGPAEAGVGVNAGVHEAMSFYDGKWTTMNSRSDSGGTSDFLNSAGSTSLTFTGSSVDWISRTTPSAGIADVYIDGEKVASVDRYSATTVYQQKVFSTSGLSFDSHTIEIVWTGRKNPLANDKNLLVDAIIVPDTIPPAVPTGVRASTSEGDVALSWDAVSDASLSGYRVYSANGTGALALVGRTTGAATSYRSLGVPAMAQLTYAVSAVDSWGNESPLSTVATVRTDATPSGSHRYAQCPAATVTVSTRQSFSTAVKNAVPGTVIRMAPGTYSGQLDITARGTIGQPIWICGSRDVVIDGGGLSVKSPINVRASSHLIVTGMTARNALKGVTVLSSDHVTISDMLVEQIGYEGVHLRAQTTDSTVVGNTIRQTGRLEAKYGEGVYIGTSKYNWCAMNECAPDLSDRNAVLANVISQTGADLIEAKEGTTGGIIRGNILSGAGGMETTESWVMIGGNDWVVVSNTGTQSTKHGFRVNAYTEGWGLRNLLADNEGTVGADGFAFEVLEPAGPGTTDTLIRCGSAVNGAKAGYSNISCSK